MSGQKILEVTTFADTGRPSDKIIQAKDYFVRFVHKLETVKGTVIMFLALHITSIYVIMTQIEKLTSGAFSAFGLG